MDLNLFKQKFIDEAESLLTNLDNVLIQLEDDSQNMQLINDAFRVMHTIKGASGMYGFEKVVEITHEVESLYDLVRDKKLDVTPMLLDFTFTAADHVRALLSDETFIKEENITRHAKLKENINLLKSNLGINTPKNVVLKEKIEEKTDALSTWNILFFPNDELIRRCVNIVYTFQDLFTLGEYSISNQPFTSEDRQFWSIFLITDKPYDEIEGALMFVLDFCKIAKIAEFNIFDPSAIEKREIETKQRYNEEYIIKDELSNDNVKDKNPEKSSLNLLHGISSSEVNTSLISKKLSTKRINVDASKLDKLMYLVSELVTSKSELLIALQKHNEQKAIDAAEKIEKLAKLFSENALSIRLVSLQEMLSQFKRLIRDLSKQLGKIIDFTIVGEDTELDKSIIDAIGEPIMHLIRNNIDHGIEMPEKRLENGKSENGSIRFEAYKSGNYVYISIIDDGNGIDTDFIYKKAVEKGFIPEGSQLSEKEIIDLIFLPGFSTAKSLSNVSGRGVGMDIVLKRIQEIRGEISVTTVKGQGTTFTIKLQQTVSIIDTLLIASGNIIYALPVEDIESCGLEARENLLNRQNNLISFDNALIPFINLRDKFSPNSEQILQENDKLIIINRQNKRYALIAENIIGEYQAVVKPLGKTFSDIKFLSGASLLGDGSIAILLDTDKLWYEISGS